jgi:S-sulfo-L-cysteine synthase (O-acetyl-L-serine-dependent)
MTSPCTAPDRTRGVSVLNAIGNTPLLRLPAIERSLPGVELYAKAEWLNPGGSVKDRPARRMVCEALERRQLGEGKRLLDATSGNTGIAYAMIGAALGFGVTLCVPENITPERRRILMAYGPELVFTDPLEGSDGAIREARRRFAADPERYFYPDQYNNAFNWRAHYDSTAAEIWEQTDGRITHFIAGLGTSGTFVGTARRLRELKPSALLISLQPDGPLHGLEGLKHMASAIVPGIYDTAVADRDIGVSTEDAYVMTRRLAAEEGLLVGISSGAALAGAFRVFGEDAAAVPAVVVMIFPDGGERYLSESFWAEER